MKKWFVFVIFLSVLSLEASFSLAEKSGAATVKIHKEASAPELRAARELAEYIQKVTGSVAGTLQDRVIRIGTVLNLAELEPSLREKLESAKNDAYGFQISDKTVLIAGKNPECALFGTYAFIEKYLGVKWFYPRELGEFLPTDKTVILEPGVFFSQADFRYRGYNVCGVSTDFVSTYDWMAKVGLQNFAVSWQIADPLPQKSAEEVKQYLAEISAVPVVGGHHGTMMAVPKKWFKDHPEYFALINGKRVSEGVVERCFSNPDVQRMVCEYYLASVKKDPRTLVKLYWQDSANAFCQCEGCRRMGEYNGKFSMTEYCHRMNKLIFDFIIQHKPDAKILVGAYWNYRNVPEDPAITYRSKNAYIRYCAHQKCYAHRFRPEVQCNQSFYNEILEWKKRADYVGLYDYRHDANCYYAPFEFNLAEELKTLRKLGFVGWEDECVPAYETKTAGPNGQFLFIANWPSMYVSAKLLWDTSVNPEKLLDEAYSLYYGKAAGVMKKYHAFRCELWDNAPGCCLLNGPVRTGFCMNVPGSEKKLYGYLAEALKLADSEKVKKRIEQDRFFLDIFWKTPYDELKKILTQKKEMVSQKADGPIVIDGKLEEPTWLKAQPVTGFLTDKKALPMENTFVRVAYDDNNIYLAVNADDSKGGIPVRKNARTRDGEVWRDDSIEIQMMPPDSNGRYYHIMMNTDGVLYDSAGVGQNFDVRYDSNAEVKVVKDGNSYIYECRIPLAPMNARIQPGKIWRIHFMRNIHNLVPPNSSEWNGLDGIQPFQPAFFRSAVFSANYIQNGNFSELDPNYKKQGFPFPKFWGPAGAAVKQHLITETAAGRNIFFNGIIYQTMRVPKGLPEGEYIFTVSAKGKGKISCTSWAFVEKYDGNIPTRSANRKETLGSVVLSEEIKDYSFSAKYLPEESWFCFYIHGNDVTVVNVMCNIKHKK